MRCGEVSILPQGLRGALRHVTGALLPCTCVLCGDDAGDGPVCGACQSDLPRLPNQRCPQCAEPTTHGERCGRCLAHPPAFDSVSALYAYEFPLDRLVQALKYGHQLALAAWFGDALAGAITSADATCILPLPLHPSRLRERGFNQAAEIARPLATCLQLSLDHDSLVRVRATRPQAEQPLAKRQGNVRNAFECHRDFSGQNILLVDDVLTSGATLDEAARVLKIHGARQVHVAVVGRALRHGG